MKLTKEFTSLEKSAVKLTVTVAKKDVQETYSATLSKYVKNAQIPGFRKGHVPANILERKFGDSLKADAMSELIDKSLNEVFEKETENRPLPYQQPSMDEMPVFDTAKDFVYTVTYDVFPKVDVKDFSGITIKEPQVTIGDKELEEELKAVQERNAVVMDKKDGESVEKDNIVTINYSELDDAEKEIDGSKREGFVFTVGTGENIYKIDDELAQKENKKYKTLDDMKKDIMHNMEVAKKRKIAEIKSQSLLEQLVEKNPFEIPASMLAAELDGRWRMMAQQFQTTPEQLEQMILASGQTKENMLTQWTGDSEKMLKSRIIVDSLIKARNVSVTPEEIEAKYAEIAEEGGITVEEVKKHYADPRTKEYLIDDAKEQKLYEELYKEVKITKGDKTSFAELFTAK